MLMAIGPGRRSGGAAPRGSVFVGTQRAYVQGYAARVGNSAAIADPIIGVVQEGATLDARVLGASGATQGESLAVRAALQRITGARPGNTVRSWEQWWREHRDDWRAPSRAEPAARPFPDEPW